MSWNYRIFKDADGNFTFRETHFGASDVVEGWTETCYPVAFEDEDTDPIQELRSQLCGMLLALSKPILDEKKLLKKAERNIARDERKKEKLKKK